MKKFGPGRGEGSQTKFYNVDLPLQVQSTLFCCCFLTLKFPFKIFFRLFSQQKNYYFYYYFYRKVLIFLKKNQTYKEKNLLSLKRLKM